MLRRAKNLLPVNRPGAHSKAVMALSLISLTWGSTWMVSRKAVQYMPPLQLASIRQLLAGSLFVLYYTRKKAVWPVGWEWVNIFILSLLNFLLTNGLTTWGVQYISGGLAAIIAAIFPLWLILIGIFQDRTGLSFRAFAGFLLGFAGICLIFYDHLGDFLYPDFRFGIFISLLASLTWAIATIYTKKQAARFNPYFSIGLQMLISGALLYLISLFSGRVIAIRDIPWQSWAGIGYLALVGSALSYFAYLYALQRLPAGQVSIYAYINPVVAVALGAVWLGERLTLFIALGVLVTLYGVYLGSTRKFEMHNGIGFVEK